MQPRKFLLTSLLLGVAWVSQAQIKPPQPKKETKVFTEHGSQRTDDYYWMSNPKDSNVINYLHAENKYTDAYLKPTEELQKKLFDELVSRIPGRNQSLPTKRNGWWYYNRFEEGKQYPYYARRKGTMMSPEEILLDVPKLAEPYKILSCSGHLHGTW